MNAIVLLTQLYICYFQFFNDGTHGQATVPVMFKPEWFPADPSKAWFQLVESDLFDMVNLCTYYEDIQLIYKTILTQIILRYKTRLKRSSNIAWARTTNTHIQQCIF